MGTECNLIPSPALRRARNEDASIQRASFVSGYRIPLYEISESTGAPIALVHLTAPQNTVRRRLKQRKSDRHAKTYSDAGWLIYTKLALVEEPVQRDHYADMYA